MMKLLLLHVLLLCRLAAASPAVDQTSLLAHRWNTQGSNYPTVFLHGILGWGEATPLFGSVYYFGGACQNIVSDLREQGHTVVAPNLGPLSSNWERACEAFAQLVGAQTDYGIARSNRFRHNRYGLDYSGTALLPGFASNFYGDTAESGRIEKINLVGHSLGGSTARFLTHLLTFGSQEEMDACASAGVECSPLFWTNKTQPLVNGVFAVSGVHQGSVVDDFLHTNGGLLTLVKGLTSTIVGVNNINNEDVIWNLQLDHYGLIQREDEDFFQFMNRICESEWFLSDSTAVYDLSVAAHETPLLTFVQNSPTTTYFSAAGVTTRYILGVAVATLQTNLFLAPFANLIGSYSNDSLSVLGTYSKEDWRQNDGMVMLASSRGPKSGFRDFQMDIQAESEAALVESAPTTAPVKGVYNYVGVLDGLDHADVVAVMDVVPGRVDSLYRNILNVLNALAP
ncbi:hypothetical protein HDU78_002767 [Chytriomyces hyalinus]|nr:hypothetical protein HDU78_002767 [Chytriomyces hyalinus]